MFDILNEIKKTTFESDKCESDLVFLIFWGDKQFKLIINYRLNMWNCANSIHSTEILVLCTCDERNRQITLTNELLRRLTCNWPKFNPVSIDYVNVIEWTMKYNTLDYFRWNKVSDRYTTNSHINYNENNIFDNPIETKMLCRLMWGTTLSNSFPMLSTAIALLARKESGAVAMCNCAYYVRVL